MKGSMDGVREGLGWSDRMANGDTSSSPLTFLIPSITKLYNFAKWPVAQSTLELVDREIKRELELLHESCRAKGGRPSGRETQEIRERVRERHKVSLRDSCLRTALWFQSERVLGILRTKGGGPVLDDSVLARTKVNWMENLNLDLFAEADIDSPLYFGTDRSLRDEQTYPAKTPFSQLSDVVRPNDYFALTAPCLVSDYGYAFHAVVKGGAKVGNSAKECVVGINTDFFAAYLGGDKRFGHDVIFYLPESRFYFYDPRVSQYVPASEDKLRLLLSQILQDRAWGQEVEQATLILNHFRGKAVLDEIMVKAKALLATEEGYFGTSQGRVRYCPVQSKANKLSQAVQNFVESEVCLDDNGLLTIAECLKAFNGFQQVRGEVIKEGAEYRPIVFDKIRELHGKKLRNDLILPDRKCASGWKGIRLRQEDQSAMAAVEN